MANATKAGNFIAVGIYCPPTLNEMQVVRVTDGQAQNIVGSFDPSPRFSKINPSQPPLSIRCQAGAVKLEGPLVLVDRDCLAKLEVECVDSKGQKHSFPITIPPSIIAGLKSANSKQTTTNYLVSIGEDPKGVVAKVRKLQGDEDLRMKQSVAEALTMSLPNEGSETTQVPSQFQEDPLSPAALAQLTLTELHRKLSATAELLDQLDGEFSSPSVGEKIVEYHRKMSAYSQEIERRNSRKNTSH